MISATRSKIQQLFTESPCLCIKVYGNTQSEDTDVGGTEGNKTTTPTTTKYECRVSLDKLPTHNSTSSSHVNSDRADKKRIDVNSRFVLLEKWEIDVVNKRSVVFVVVFSFFPFLFCFSVGIFFHY